VIQVDDEGELGGRVDDEGELGGRVDDEGELGGRVDDEVKPWETKRINDNI